MARACRFPLKLFLSGLALACVLALATPASSATLITMDEAKLPPSAFPSPTRGITRGPTVKLESPTGSVTSPFRLIVTFVPYGGAQIMLDSVKLTYLRNPGVDLTGRIKPFITAQGLGITAAEAPPGKHDLILEVTDSNARVVKLPISIIVDPPK